MEVIKMSMIGDNAMEVEPVATNNLGSLAKLILPELPGCDDFMVRMKLGAALREFCRETNACVVEMPAKKFNDPHTFYDLALVPPPPDGMVIGSVLSVCDSDGHDVPFSIVGNKILFDSYSTSDTIKVKFSVYPKAGGEACPEWFVERYAEAITAGAMQKLLSMTGKAWSDPNRAVQYGAEYSDAISEASYRSTGSQLAGGAENAIPQGGLFM
jgi:hypothetical protein